MTRLWGMIRATFERRGVVEGHASGLRDANSISTHLPPPGSLRTTRCWTPEETWEKLIRGLFVELRPYAMDKIIPFLIGKGLQDWSQIAFTTDDRSASDTLKLGASDYNARHRDLARPGAGDRDPVRDAQPGAAHATDAVGGQHRARAVRRHGAAVGRRVAADRGGVGGRRAGFHKARRFIGAVPKIDWPEWATRTINIRRAPDGRADFRIGAATGRNAMHAAVLRPFHWADGFLTYGPAGAGWRGAARPRAQRHQVRHRRSFLRRGEDRENVLGRRGAARCRKPRSPARSRTTSTICGWWVRPTPRWRWR